MNSKKYNVKLNWHIYFLLCFFLLINYSSISQNKKTSDSTNSKYSRENKVAKKKQDTAQNNATPTEFLQQKPGDFWEGVKYDLSVEFVGWVIGLIIGSGLTILYIFFNRKLNKRKFKQIFGEDIKSFNIIYPSLTLMQLYNAHHTLVEFPYQKGTNYFKMSQPVSLADLTAAIYISELFFSQSSQHPAMKSDISVQSKLDFSFCAVGGISNYKTVDLLNDDDNKYFKFTQTNPIRIVRIIDNKYYDNTNEFDLGIIIKMKSTNFPNRTHICIAGLGEPGTSGAAWYLSHNWKQIRKKAKRRNFGAIIKVKKGADESATLVDLQYQIVKSPLRLAARNLIAFVKKYF